MVKFPDLETLPVRLIAALSVLPMGATLVGWNLSCFLRTLAMSST